MFSTVEADSVKLRDSSVGEDPSVGLVSAVGPGAASSFAKFASIVEPSTDMGSVFGIGSRAGGSDSTPDAAPSTPLVSADLRLSSCLMRFCSTFLAFSSSFLAFASRFSSSKQDE